MTTTDTSAEAVKRLIAGATSEPWEVDAASTFCALLAERDWLRAAILDTAPHDAGLVPMRLRLMAKGETRHD
jgi:hypothetical protein